MPNNPKRLTPQQRFLKTVEEPHFMAPLDYSLTSHTDISPWKSAKDWLDADTNQITSITQVFVTSTKSAEIENAHFGGDMIYQRLIIYVFAHLMFCTCDKRLLRSFKETLMQWRNWDFMTRISNHQLIKDYLLDCFRRDSWSCPELHCEIVLGQLLSFDAIRLCVQLTVMVTDDTRYKQLVDLRGPKAQVLLNLLQARLNVPVDLAYKRRHVKALIRLSGATGLYPECLVLDGIEILGDAVEGGGFADIFKGRLRGQEIAVKMLKVYQKSDIEKLLKEFSSEAVTWRQLSHPNVLPFYGVYQLARNPPRVCLVCPWMENGNLAWFLADQVPDIDCVPLSLDVALGMEYLHGEGIIHGDLKAVNILVSPSRRACLSDFGLATARDSKPTVRTYMSSSRATGTLRWQAPELLNTDADSRTTFATDVYAFAMVCYEMFSGTYPFDDIANDFKVILAIQQGKRPSLPSHNLSRVRGWSDEILHLIEACWAEKPDDRLSAGQIVEKLRALPDRPVDERPFDTFDTSFPSQVLQSHPFSVVVTSAIMEELGNS